MELVIVTGVGYCQAAPLGRINSLTVPKPAVPVSPLSETQLEEKSLALLSQPVSSKSVPWH